MSLPEARVKGWDEISELIAAVNEALEHFDALVITKAHSLAPAAGRFKTLV